MARAKQSRFRSAEVAIDCRVRKLAPRLAHLDEGVRVNYAVLLGQKMPNC